MGSMRLKEVQLENFKSFGKKITVPFLPGFTAITGPNGSGKSNISDAILFILGPRSPKTIRAGRLTDLIYNGKKNVKHCTVSLVLEDGDETIRLTRKVKRSPLPDDPDNYYSYFYINGKSSSLTEFVQLLSSANISDTCIVQQGDVTAVVEMGDVPRRKIIDDIAGVSEFDRDIEKSEKEKAEVEQNLEHLGIILKEIKSQLRKLKRERDDALKYRDMQEELKRTKAMRSYKKRLEVEKEIGEIEKQIQSYKDERERLKEQRKELQERYRAKQLELQEIEDTIADLGGEEVEELKEQINEAREEAIKAKEKINYYSKEISESKQEREELKATHEKLQKEVRSYEKKIGELEQQREQVEQQLEEASDELEGIKDRMSNSDERAMDITRSLAKIKKRYEQERQALHELELEQDRLKQQMESLDVAISELEEDKNTYEFELKDVTWQIKEIQKSQKEQLKEKKRLEQELFDRKKEESEISESLQELDQQVMRYQRELAKLKARREASSYTRAAQEILKARNEGTIRGIHGSISELGRVDDQYQRALGVAAGRRAEAIVVDDDEVAATCISYLKKHDYGRTTFLPLSKMTAGKPRGKALMTVKEDGSHGFAIDLVSFDAEYRAAFWYVFRDTIVMEDLTSARKVMGGVRLVTLDGEIVGSSGAMIGGSTPRKASFGKGDQRKVGDISKKLREVTQQQEALSERLMEVREQISTVQQQLRECTIEEEDQLERLDARKKEFNGKLKVITERLEAKQEERDTLQQKINGVEQDIEEKTARIEEMEREREETEQQLKQISTKEITQKIDALKERLEELRERQRSLVSDIRTRSKELEVAEERRREVEDRLQAIDSQREEYQAEIERLKKVHEENQEKMEALMEVEDNMLGKRKGLTEERDALYRESVDIENKIDSISTKVETNLDLISRAKSRLPTLEETLGELLIETQDYEFSQDELSPLDELKARIKELERDMERLQPVNMRALEEYERQEERKQSFDEDIDRLREQRKNLINLVDEIKTKKKDAFFAVYDAVKEHFSEIYAELTPGDAKLELENPEQPFDGGLIIRARPKGKRSLRLNALSGGEKSMASLAFIFALQAYDPSPFYILDEVDMFLDGKNAERVASMIQQRARSTQFIAISLRRITLNRANHIYGVTMHDNGVSTLIGNVEMEEVEQLVEVK